MSRIQLHYIKECVEMTWGLMSISTNTVQTVKPRLLHDSKS